MLQSFADWLVYSVLGLNPASHWGAALNFFIYDTIKITLLLFLITFVMGYINSYFPVEKVRDYLSRKKLYGLEYFFAVLLGAVTPFCSCSSIPLFIGFVRGGIPLGVTFAFLISSPLISEIAIAMLWGSFGWQMVTVYLISGMILGMVGGYVLGKMKLEPLLSPWVKQVMQQPVIETEASDAEKLTLAQRFPGVVRGAWDIVHAVFLYILIGIAVGAVIHGFVPTGFFEAYIGKQNPFAVPLAVILGAPMYANPAGVVPVLEALVDKGVPIGTALAFIMSVIALSLPEAMLLKKVMTWKLMAYFFGFLIIAIIISGYVFNIIL
ncbi:MAG: permease [Petrimonas sp.]|nr:permease [Petrimonas sp.]